VEWKRKRRGKEEESLINFPLEFLVISVMLIKLAASQFILAKMLSTGCRPRNSINTNMSLNDTYKGGVTTEQWGKRQPFK